jgi:hypothetical protein
MKAKVLFTDKQGIARFVDYPVVLKAVNERVSLSDVVGATGFQLRESPPKVFNQWHCTARESTQWVVVTGGHMRVGLRDESFEDFSPGDMFLSMDIQPGDKFEEHCGHTSQAVGEDPLQTMFIKVPYATAHEVLTSHGIDAIS